PAGLYPNNPQETNTYGVLATFVTSADASEEAVYTVVKAVFENFEDFKKLHPAFGLLEKEDMVKNGLSAPLHPGAEKYFKEKGLLWPRRCLTGVPSLHAAAAGRYVFGSGPRHGQRRRHQRRSFVRHDASSPDVDPAPRTLASSPRTGE